jgi:hypothetical protein
VSELQLSAVSGSACGLASSLLFVARTAAANDPDLFGRAVRYSVGEISPTIFHRSSDLAGSDAQSFVDSDRFRICLPAGSADSLLRFSLTPCVSYFASNPTAETLTATLILETSLTIDSAALDNPLLIDRTTRHSFDGSLRLDRLTALYVGRTLPATGGEPQTVQYSQECISGLISLQTLQTTHGLSRSQAQRVLQSAMTVRFSTVTTVLNHLFVATKLGVELFGY